MNVTRKIFVMNNDFLHCEGSQLYSGPDNEHIMLTWS